MAVFCLLAPTQGFSQAAPLANCESQIQVAVQELKSQSQILDGLQDQANSLASRLRPQYEAQKADFVKSAGQLVSRIKPETVKLGQFCSVLTAEKS